MCTTNQPTDSWPQYVAKTCLAKLSPNPQVNFLLQSQPCNEALASAFWKRCNFQRAYIEHHKYTFGTLQQGNSELKRTSTYIHTPCHSKSPLWKSLSLQKATIRVLQHIFAFINVPHGPHLSEVPIRKRKWVWDPDIGIFTVPSHTALPAQTLSEKLSTATQCYTFLLFLDVRIFSMAAQFNLLRSMSPVAVLLQLHSLSCQ